MSVEDVEKLKRNNKELQEIINNSWDGIGIIDKSTKLIYVNNAFMPILGFSKEEISNTNLISYMKDEYKKPFLELLNIEQNNEKKYKAEIDIVCIRKDNKDVHLKITISSMLNKSLFVINTKDITSEVSDIEILDDYVASMHIDLHGYIMKASSAFLNLFDYTKDDIINKDFKSLFHNNVDEIIFKNIEKTLELQQEYSGRLKAQDSKSNSFWVNVKVKPMYNKYGDVIGYTSLIFDITNTIDENNESLIVEEELRNAKKEFSEKNEILKEQSKLAVISETLQKLSHEWRQPLNLISLQAQKLELDFSMGEVPEIDSTIEALQKIKNEADNLSNTIEDFQSFIKNEPIEVKTTPKQIIDSAIEESNLNQYKEKINIIVDYEENFNFLTSDKQLILVLVNILLNAKEQIERNNLQSGEIKVVQYHNDDRIIFEIYDNAGGIDEEIIHKVFEPYFSTKEKRHGVGLGLYTSKLIVNLQLQGIITVTNTKDGVTVKISIPINEGI